MHPHGTDRIHRPLVGSVFEVVQVDDFSRFAVLIGTARRYTYRLVKQCVDDPVKGPWPAPVVDRIEPVIAKHGADWPACGHRRIRAIAAIDDHDIISESSMKRAMARRICCDP